MQQIFINTIPQETRIAVVENDKLMELYIENRLRGRTVGNIYKGKVTNVLPGMQAAFVDIGFERDAFLYVMDVLDNFEELEELLLEEIEENTHPYRRDINGRNLSHSNSIASKISIDELLQIGQEVIVQVAKEPIGTKGARVTSHINLPGRYLVYMPTINHIGISRKITDEVERERIREIVSKLDLSNGGCIVRTAAEGKGAVEFEKDLSMLKNLWKEINIKYRECKAPALLHRDYNPIYRVVRDFLTPEVEFIMLDSEEEYQNCLNIVYDLAPEFVNKIKLYTKSAPIFEAYRIEDEIQNALNKKIWLKSGGYLVIEQTEALVAIDVNTGKNVGRNCFEDTAFEINLEAVKEIARQVRLRNLGGIIIVDFIDMSRKENRDKVLEALKNAFKSDRSRTHIFPFTNLGLVEITRKRINQSLMRNLSSPCPYCKGYGYIKDPRSICYQIRRELEYIVNGSEEKDILIRVNPAVASLLRNEEKEIIDEIQISYKKNISIKADESLHHEQFEIITF